MSKVVNRCLNAGGFLKTTLVSSHAQRMDPDYQEVSSDTAYHDSANEINLYETVLIKELWVRMGKVP